MSEFTEIRSALEREEQELLTRASKIERDLRRPVNPDWEEAATERENDEVLEGLDDHTLARLAEVREALTRLREGSFGLCRECGEVIDPRRLEALPTTTVCVECAD